MRIIIPTHDKWRVVAIPHIRSRHDESPVDILSPILSIPDDQLLIRLICRDERHTDIWARAKPDVIDLDILLPYFQLYTTDAE